MFVISKRSCRRTIIHTIIRTRIEAHAVAPQLGVLSGARHHVNVPQHSAASVGHIVLGFRWAVDGMVGSHVEFGAVLETHFTLPFQHNQQFLVLSGAVFPEQICWAPEPLEQTSS
jgi:hypothetical protein